jgi:hypothetical protein
MGSKARSSAEECITLITNPVYDLAAGSVRMAGVHSLGVSQTKGRLALKLAPLHLNRHTDILNFFRFSASVVDEADAPAVTRALLHSARPHTGSCRLGQGPMSSSRGTPALLR